MSLNQKVVSGAKWTSLSAAVGGGLQVAQTGVLARLLYPDEFGLMAMLMVIIGLGQAYADMGVSNAIVCRQGVTPNQLSSLYWLNVLAGVTVFLLSLALAPLVVAFYREPRLMPLIHWSVLAFVITPFGQQFQVLLQKELHFRSLALCEMTSKALGFAVSVIAALAGNGVYALIWGTLASCLTFTVAIVIVGLPLHRPLFRLKTVDIREFLGFGLYQMGERTSNFFNSNLDKLVIGRLLGADALGWYNLASNLVVQPMARINPIMTRIMFPVFAKMQSQPEKLKSAYLNVINILSWTNGAALCGIAAVAPIMVPVVFGERWAPAIVLIQVLAFVALMRGIGDPTGSLLLARGRADLGFKWNLGLLLLQPIGILAGAYLGGIQGVAFGLLAVQIVCFFLGYYFLLAPLLGPCWSDYVLSMSPAFYTSFTMAGVVSGLVALLRRTTLDSRLVLALVIGTGVAYCLIASLLTNRAKFADLIRYAGLSR